MTSQVTIFENIFDGTSKTYHDIGSINEFLAKRYHKFPDTGRIYFRFVADSCEVTPHNEAEIERLEKLHGVFYVVIYPEGLELIAIIILAVLAAVSIALSFLLRPSAQPDRSASPNNSLSDRQNSQRRNERIPDIFGTVRSTPDLIAVPYRVFIGNQEVEYDYMCIGKGAYQVTQVAELVGDEYTGPIVYDMKEDQTFVETIDGCSVEVYAPFTSPNSGDTPQIRVGSAINEPIKNVMKSSSVIGQILRAPNDQTVNGDNNIRAIGDGEFNTNDSNIDFTAYFAIGDQLTVSEAIAQDPGSGATADINGTYVVLAVSTSSITVDIPSGLLAAWATVETFTGGASKYESFILVASGSRVIGPFILDVANLTEVWANFVATNGLFKISGSTGNQYEVDDDIAMYVQCLDDNYNPVGSVYSSYTTVYGSAITQQQRASTLKVVLPTRADGSPAGRVQVSAVRLTNYDTSWQGTTQDEIQWRDLFGVSPIPMTDFGNVTTVQTKEFATPQALTASQRKFNLEVTRMFPPRDPVTHEIIPALGLQLYMPSNLVIYPVLAGYTDYEYLQATASLINIPSTGPAPTGTIKIYTSDGSLLVTQDVTTGNAVVDTAFSSDSFEQCYLIAKYSGDSNYSEITVRAYFNFYDPDSDDVAGHPHPVPAVIPPSVPVTVQKLTIDNYVPTDNAADALVEMALDPYIGNRMFSELDWNGIYDTLGAAYSNIPTPIATYIPNVTAYDGTGMTFTDDATVTVPIAAAPRTICGWIKTALTTQQLYFGYGTPAGNSDFVLGSGIAYGGCLYFVGYAADIVTTVPIADNTWHHIAATYDGTTVKLYCDGVMVGSENVALTTAISDFMIGKQSWVPAWAVNGSMRDVRLFDVALTSAQIATIAQGLDIERPDGAVAQYFGTSLCCQFCYTFDDTQTSFEEMVSDLGMACFCTAYRQGSLLKVFFEEQTDLSVLLFNHRNKLPGSETRTVTFGLTNDYDGIELDYIDPDAPNYPQLETTVTLHYPPGAGGVTTAGTATAPRKIKTVGIRNNVQATILGWRLYNKMRYQNTATEFKGTQEAALVVNMNRILVADNTRPDTQDGQINEQNGLTLTLSQPCTLTAGSDWTIFLQHYDGTVETIPITGVAGKSNQVVLSRAPVTPLVLDPAMFAPTTYQIASNQTMIFDTAEAVLSWDEATGNGVITCPDCNFEDVKVGDKIRLINFKTVDPGGHFAPTEVSGWYTVAEVVSDTVLELSGMSWEFIDDYDGHGTNPMPGRIIDYPPQYQSATPFLLTDKTAEDGMTFTCRAMNYDDRYYYHDYDFKNGVLLLNGGPGSYCGFGYCPGSGGSGGSGGGSRPSYSVSVSSGSAPSAPSGSGSIGHTSASVPSESTSFPTRSDSRPHGSDESG